MKIVKHIVGIVSTLTVALSIAVASAQTPVAATTSMSPVPPPMQDLSMLTNHASLVGYAFKQVADVSMWVSSAAQAQNWEPSGYFTFTNQVKNERTLNAVLSQYWWGIQTVDTNAYINTGASFMNNPTDGVSPTYSVFQAYGGGYPVNMGSYWGFPGSYLSMPIQLAPNIWIALPGVVDARLIITDQWGEYGMQISTQNGGFWFPSDYTATNVVLVLTRNILGTDGYWRNYTQGYSFATGTEILLTWVQFQMLLTDSQDFITYSNPSGMDVSIFTSQSYGKVPLLMPTFVKDLTKGVKLSVHTTEGQYATGFIIENLLTGDKLTIPVPAGQTSITRDFSAGDYSIIPLGISLKAPSQYYYYGKG